MVKFRKKSLFCPESIILFIGFVITFYDILVLNNLDYIIGGGLFRQFSEEMVHKSTCLSLIGFSTFVIGEEIGKNAYEKKKNSLRIGFPDFPTVFAIPMHILAISVVTLVFMTGLYTEFMKYTLGEGENANTINIMISVLIMVSSVLEFLRLYKSKLNSKKITPLILNINIVYVVTVIIWSLFLLLTGNRGDMMLIAFPPIILFYFLLKRFNNRYVFLGAIIGALIMIFVGLTRQGNYDYKNEVVELGLFGMFRDYGAAYVNQQGLIQYTDSHGIYGVSAGIKALASSVPFLGGLMFGDSSSSNSDGNTNKLSTEQWQLASNMDSGLGTNLLGDLYYAGGLPFVVIYMCILGWFLSYCYERLYNKKYLNAFSLFTYCWIFADCLYILRAPYYHLFRQIGFSLVIYFSLYVLSNIGTDKSSKTKLNIIKHST